MFTKQNSEENKIVTAAALNHLREWTLDQLCDFESLKGEAKIFCGKMALEHPEIPSARVKARFFVATRRARGMRIKVAGLAVSDELPY